MAGRVPSSVRSLIWAVALGLVVGKVLGITQWRGAPRAPRRGAEAQTVPTGGPAAT